MSVNLYVKPKLICFNGSMLWKLFVAELIPEIKIEDVYYGLQHIGIQKASGTGFFEYPKVRSDL